MSTPSADRNLLFGLLALQMDFVSREALLDAMQAWMLRKGDPLGLVLQQRGALGEAEREAVERLVEVHAARHGGARESLAAMRVEPEVCSALESVADGDVQASVASLLTVDDRRAEPAGPASPPRGASRYRKVREHARGGLGEVHVAVDEELGREVALKEIQARHADRAEYRERFVREAEITGHLEHPGIVPVYGLGSHDDGRPYYAMRFVRGESLQEAIARFHQADAGPRRDAGERELSLRALLTRFVAVCNAVAYAHSRGVVHRDLKPANVMLGEYGETLIVDWGLAKRLDLPEGATPVARPVPTTGVAATELGQAVGTPAFMPPEQARGELDKVDQRSDVFALGATLYCLLTGRPPYERDGVSLLAAAAEADYLPARRANARVPADLEAVCCKAMARQPADRYASAGLLAADVERFLADEPVGARREPAWQKARRWARRNRTLVAGGVALLLAGVAGLGVGLGAVRAEQGRTVQALGQARAHLARAEQAEKLATGNLEQAEANFALARRAVDDCFGVAKDHPDLQLPNMQKARRVLFEKALAFYQRFRAERPDDIALRREKLENHMRIGHIHIELSQPGQAAEEFLKAERLARELVRASEAPSHQLALAAALDELGTARYYRGKTADAVKHLSEAVALCERLVATHPDRPEFRRQFAWCQLRLGLYRPKREDAKNALGHVQRATEEYRRLAGDQPEEEGYRVQFAGALMVLAYYQSDSGQPELAVKSAVECADLLRGLLKRRPNSFAHQGRLRQALVELGINRQTLGQFEQASRDYTEAIDLARQCYRAQPDVPQEARSLAGALSQRAVLSRRLDRLPEALKDIDEALRLMNELQGRTPGDVRTSTWTVDVLTERAHILGRLNRHREAVADWDRAADLVPHDLPLSLRLGRAASRVRAGDPGRAVAEAAELAGEDLKPGEQFYLACVWSLCAAATAADPARPLPLREHEADAHARRALGLLARLAQAGYFRQPTALASLHKDTDLDFLRHRADFKALVAGLPRPAK